MRTALRRPGSPHEFLLALLPMVTALPALGEVKAFSRPQLRFASIGSRAFLIHSEALHGTNSVCTSMIAQLGSAGCGLLAVRLPGAATAAMIAAIVLMVLWEARHSPAASTALSFFPSAPLAILCSSSPMSEWRRFLSCWKGVRSGCWGALLARIANLRLL